MIIIGQSFTELVNSNIVSGFYIDNICGENFIDKFQVCAAMSHAGIVIGEYGDKESAKVALRNLFNAIASEKETGQTSYQLE